MDEEKKALRVKTVWFTSGYLQSCCLMSLTDPVLLLPFAEI